ncbi:class I SAM-dependent methyltransferase [Tardiphaga sp. 803_E3_N1_3]|uniref:class I SAM-dependent methyltransferase n=1 Tax=Tardiphaga sp. 803_E3_N1_3 TaxID=3240785 RepID=UPI003F29BE87
MHKATYSDGVATAHEYFLAQRKWVAHGTIVSCSNCEFVWTSPQFEAAEYNEIYEKAGQAVKQDAGLLTAELARGRRLSKIVRRHRVGGRLLDFGCGSGGFLKSVSGFERIGFEVASLDSHERLPFPVITGDFLSIVRSGKIEAGSFDVVTAWDVLEHLPNLETYVAALKSLLRPGGLLCFSVPNVGSMFAKLAGGRWNAFLLEHLWYFSPKTSDKFFNDQRLTRVEIGSLPYDVPLSHLVRRVAQTYGISGLSSLNSGSGWILPMPLGVMYAVYSNGVNAATVDFS